MNIEIWDKKSTFRNFEKDVWFNLHPESKYKTLVYADYIGICYLEDIKEMGYVGGSDIEIITKYVLDYMRHLENRDYNKDIYSTINEKVNKIEATIKENTLNSSISLVELMEQQKSEKEALVNKQEKDKIELSTAIVELAEQLAQQG